MNYEKNVYLCLYEKDVINIVGCSSCIWSRNFDGNYGEMVVVFNHKLNVLLRQPCPLHCEESDRQGIYHRFEEGYVI